MARQTKAEQLTLSQISQIRNTAAKRVAGLLRRLGEYAAEEGMFAPRTVIDENGNEKIVQKEMTMAQINAARTVIQNVLPSQQMTTIQDVSDPVLRREEIEAMYRDALKRLQGDDVRMVLLAMPDSERQKALSGIDTEKLVGPSIEGESERMN